MLPNPAPEAQFAPKVRPLAGASSERQRMTDKQARAETIVLAILALMEKHGSVLPLPKCPGRLLRIDSLEAKLFPGRRWSVAPGYRERMERRLIDDAEWLTLELSSRGTLMFVANLTGERVDIHFFRPGAWEKEFGADRGDDTVIQQPWDEPIGPNVDDQHRLRREDLALSPRSTGPATGDELRNPTMRQRRSRVNIRAVDGPYTVALSERTAPGF
jgi:hypothetical protein